MKNDRVVINSKLYFINLSEKVYVKNKSNKKTKYIMVASVLLIISASVTITSILHKDKNVHS